jgi:hypothetical protein
LVISGAIGAGSHGIVGRVGDDSRALLGGDGRMLETIRETDVTGALTLLLVCLIYLRTWPRGDKPGDDGGQSS